MRGAARNHAAASAKVLREFTRTPTKHGIFEMLIRAAVMSPAAADVLVKADLRTRADRSTAVIAAVAAMAAELDECEPRRIAPPTTRRGPPA
jgi:predicted xylose isomerase-like sugar epimerase